MKKRVERLRGMYDLLPEAYQQQQWLTERMRTFLASAGYAPVDAPVLERSDLFLPASGRNCGRIFTPFTCTIATSACGQNTPLRSVASISIITSSSLYRCVSSMPGRFSVTRLRGEIGR